MKLNSVIRRETKKRAAFTLIEMIGVLAVIAILAAMLIPRVFSAIADAKVNNTVVSTDTIKTALADHYGKYGKFDSLFGTNSAAVIIPNTNYDMSVLFPEGLIDKPYQTKLGTNWSIQLQQCNAANVAPGGNGISYSLTGGNTNDVVGQYVLQAVLYGVAEADAQAISSRIDGPSLSATAIGNNDYVGRVQYTQNGGGATTVYVYLTHR